MVGGEDRKGMVGGRGWFEGRIGRGWLEGRIGRGWLEEGDGWRGG